jgi:hypothetical protein
MLVTIAMLVTISAAIGACGGNDDDASQLTATSADGENELPVGDEIVELDPATFTADIDHPYWPMEPGTRWTYRESDGEGGTLDVVVIVTRKTKLVANGVTARVVRDTVSENGTIVEDTFDWYAEDDEGTLWYLGEDTAEFDNGVISSREGSFEAGRNGAQAGVILPADPQVGMQYRQEYYAGHAEDNGEVLGTDERVEAAYGSFDGALLTEDTNALEPDVVEHKSYAKGVGPVLTIDISGGSGREELISVDQAPPGAGEGPLGSL